MGNVRLYGATSGYTELAPPAVAPDGVLSLPSGTGTIAKTTDQGLVHINTTTFSAVSSVSLNTVFTSTYANYRIICHLTSASADTTLNVRLRVSAADNTTTNYAFGGYFQSYGAGLTTEGGTSQTLFQISGARNGANSFASFDMIAPELAQRTMYAGSGSDAANGRNYVGTFNATTVFDGFSLFPGTGNITGTIRVYGYKNS